MKKKKMKKSELTASERKQLRRDEQARAAGERPEAEKAERASRSKVYAVALLVVAVIVISVGVAVPTYMSCNYMFERNPVAVIEMKAGDRTLTMKYELFAADCPRACANFVFLAEAGFFDGAVVFDTQNSRVRFGGYYLTEDASGGVSYAHRSDDTAFLSGLTDEISEEHYTDSDGETDYSEMLRYTLRSDSTSYDYTAYDFMLCANVSGSDASATEFQICGRKDTLSTNDTIWNEAQNSPCEFEVQAFGRPLGGDEATGEAIEYILGMEKSDTYMRSYFLSTAEPVTVSSVKIYNFETTWTENRYEHGFESYMEEINGINVSSSNWTKKYI